MGSHKIIFTLLILIPLSVFGKTKKLKHANNKPIHSIKQIFAEYIEYNESTDTQENKEMMKKSLKSLKKVIYKKEVLLLINVWMYYDPTDFPTRELVKTVLKNNKHISIEMIKHRIKDKKKWEENSTAPYSELKELLMELENGY